MPMPPVERVRIPVQLRASLSQPTYLKKACGYCSVPNRTGDAHKYCKRAIRSGDGHIMLCPCVDPAHDGPAADSIFCTECDNTNLDELDEKLFLCWDKEDCEARISKRMESNPTHQLIHQAYLDADRTKAATNQVRARAKNPGRPSSGKCLCCGETTGGGKFLPGHDARLVSQTAARVAAGADPLVTLAEFRELGVSDALIGKLQRKLEKL